MSVAVNRRSVMTLFSHSLDPASHRVRLVLAEKGVTSLEYVQLGSEEVSEDLMELNPYHTIPTLVDREVVIHESPIIMEYLDERFPHPPLMPVDPAARARTRQAMQRIEQDLYSLIPLLEEGEAKSARKAKKRLRESLVTWVDVFAAKPYFLSDDFTLVDCSMAPILWRLRHYGIDLPQEADPIIDYQKRLFSRPGFQQSLSRDEQALAG